MNSINDVSFASLLSLQPPNKRKRVSTGTSIKDEASEILDRRVKPSKALDLSGQLITVIVGPDSDDNDEESKDLQDELQETFYVHQHAICAASPFFANAMKPEWASSRPDPRTITLPEDDPAAFSIYMSYLYAKELPILNESTASQPTTPEGKYRDIDNGYHNLAYAYVLGERLMDPAFKNAIIDAYVLYARGSPPAKRCYPSNEEIRILYEGTHEDSPIRKLLIDIWTARGKWEWVQMDPDLPNEFLMEVTKGLLKSREGSDGGGSLRGGREGLSRPWKLTHEQYYEK
ncbi:hypothetical protein B0J11DRAFT_513407 [Dendryphion nanum]|uniref:BTB domain-containing protein n=1 Tax=Dendryphion nanum TaxID=256645 RepID=A0A9P9IWC8_9PLEO|nr:hypothetical protein B0J11DRAFT_513407 [Dendryphion nanum]